MKIFPSMQWLTSMALSIQHFGNVLLAKLWELVTEVGAKDTPRSSLKVCFSLSFFKNLFSFQCIPFNRLYTGQCTFSVEQETELVKLILTFGQAGFPLSKKKVCSLAYQFAH